MDWRQKDRMKSLPKEKPGSNIFTADIYQIFKERILDFLKFQKTKQESFLKHILQS